MTTLAHTHNVEAGSNNNFSGAEAKRVIISSDARAIMYVFAIIGVVTVAPFALLGQYFAPNVAKDLRHESEMLSQAGDSAGAVAASRRAVDVYRGLMRASAVVYAPKLAASLHDLSVRLNEAGDHAGALAAIQEAIEMRRRLAKYSPTYAESLEQSLQLLTTIESAQRGELANMKAVKNTVR